MKYCRVVAIVLAAGGVLVACGSGSDTPTDADAACNAALKEHDCVQREDASGQVISGGTADCDSPTKHAGGFSHAWAQSKNVELSSGEFTEISAVYTVPPAPVLPCNQTLYYFVGLQDPTDAAETSIIQPVLGWDEEQGGWFLMSEDCCQPKNRISQIIPVSTGDKIQAKIEKSGDNFIITTAHGSKTTVLTAPANGRKFTEAVAAFEVYKLESCGEQPAVADFVFEIVSLKDQDGDVDQPWLVKTDLDSCPGDITVTRF